MGRHALKPGDPFKGPFQHFFIFLAWYLERAEPFKMRCGELRVEKYEALSGQVLYQIGEADLRGVALAREHAFPEKCAPQCHAIEATGQFALIPGFDGVTTTDLEQLRIGPPDRLVDPCACAFAGSAGASLDDARKIAVEPDFKNTLTDGFLEASRNVEAVERYDTALFRTNPENLGIVRFLGYRKYARGIGPQEHLRLDYVVVRGGGGFCGHFLQALSFLLLLARYFSNQWMS